MSPSIPWSDEPMLRRLLEEAALTQEDALRALARAQDAASPHQAEALKLARERLQEACRRVAAAREALATGRATL